MFCTTCGAVNADGGRFCVECGAPLADAADDATVLSGQGKPAPRPSAVPVARSATPSVPPVPLPPSSAASDAGTPGDGTVAPAPSSGPSSVPPSRGPSALAAAPRNRLPLMLAVVVAIAVVVAGLAAFLTYRAEVWGGKTLPDPSSVAKEVTAANGKKTSVVKARDVTAALEAKGLKTKTVQVFSGADRGVFIGYSGASQGERVNADSTVTVRESAGPGVPKGTIGKDVDKVVDTFADMGVPVHYKQVVISSDSKTPEGRVSATYPAPGVGLGDDELDKGIFVGVATKGDGIPVDILGADKSDAVDELESQGYDVDLEPHYSSERYVGKISGSYPAPGSAPEPGDSVTLYYGVDKSDNMDLFSEDEGGVTVLKENATPMIGMYCRSQVQDVSKDCITLEEADDGYASDTYLQIKGREPSDRYDTLGLAPFTQNVVPLSGSGLSGSDLPMKNHLLMKQWGMFELYAGRGLMNCGDRLGGTGAPMSCSATPTFDMKDFLLYVPVGSDLEALEDSGYFDAGSLQAAHRQKGVDTSRPFILMRDASQYDQTKVPANGGLNTNPFVPVNDNGANHLVKMKPAPSDATAYYLVEQDGDLDWSDLPDATVKDVK
ncbi:PASTA domain-containing protein [Bifidobacterium platyrrhinorum]|uniref:PASTA domain-containing protein n=1 Tax=Bifidobacterium platyrrhinorum TaxID=2661628 RepID=A0A6L9SU65_9BIFI|nr:PASTA domain-containing protein [Bifidobacterium platyrrhinorum]NEG55353.1 PASTA domain-containing protein [Bifidobacterium platyrrhinorum]